MKHGDSGENDANRHARENGEQRVARDNTIDPVDGTRRRLLLAAGATAAVLAGCVGGDDDGGSDEGDRSDGGGDENGERNGGDGDDNNGNGEGGDGGDDSDGSDDGADDSDGGGSGGDDGDEGGNGGDGGDEDGNGGDESDDGGEGGDGGDDDGSVSARFFDSFRWENSFRYEIVAGPEGAGGEILYDRGNVYTTAEDEQGNTVELYLLDGQYYIVTEGQCIVYDTPAGDGFTEEPTGINGSESLEQRDPEIREVGTDTIEGDPVTVYEVDAETTYTMYVLGSGYPRRVEIDGIVADYSDWGEVGPIEPPEMDCRPPGGNSGSYP